MKDNLDKHIEKLVDKAMKHSVLESPSADYTNVVMERVNALGKISVTTYRPLFSKPMWIALFAIAVVMVSYIVFGAGVSESSWFDTIDLSVITETKLSNALSGFEVSKTVVYAIVFFGLMLFIQVPILKKYFDNRLVV